MHRARECFCRTAENPLRRMRAVALALTVAACGGGGGGGGDTETSSDVLPLPGADGQLDIPLTSASSSAELIIAEVDSGRTDGRFSVVMTDESVNQTVAANVVDDGKGNIVAIEIILFVDHNVSNGANRLLV